jgi:hypothetical protein
MTTTQTPILDTDDNCRAYAVHYAQFINDGSSTTVAPDHRAYNVSTAMHVIVAQAVKAGSDEAHRVEYLSH